MIKWNIHYSAMLNNDLTFYLHARNVTYRLFTFFNWIIHKHSCEIASNRIIYAYLKLSYGGETRILFMIK